MRNSSLSRFMKKSQQVQDKLSDAKNVRKKCTQKTAASFLVTFWMKYDHVCCPIKIQI
jgi:DNA-binding protein YbaB